MGEMAEHSLNELDIFQFFQGRSKDKNLGYKETCLLIYDIIGFGTYIHDNNECLYYTKLQKLYIYSQNVQKLFACTWCVLTFYDYISSWGQIKHNLVKVRY